MLFEMDPKKEIPPALKLFLGAIAASFLLVQLIFGSIFMAAPAYVFEKYWWPALQQYLAGQFTPQQSAVMLWLFLAGIVFFFGMGLLVFVGGVKSLFRFFTLGFDGFADQQRLHLDEKRKRLKARPITAAPARRAKSFMPVKKGADGSYQVSISSAYRLLALVAGSFAIFWNVVVGLGLADLLKGGSGGLFFAIFLLPFVLVGLGLLGATGYLLLASLHPALVLRLEKDDFARGETVKLQWKFEKAPTRLRHFDLTLQVVEILIEGTGEDESRLSHTLYEQIVAAQVPLRFQKEGTINIPLPTHPEPSSANAEREVVWHLKIHGKANGAPDLRFWLPIQVT